MPTPAKRVKLMFEEYFADHWILVGRKTHKDIREKYIGEYIKEPNGNRKFKCQEVIIHSI